VSRAAAIPDEGDGSGDGSPVGTPSNVNDLASASSEVSDGENDASTAPLIVAIVLFR
jgi:hypothetical protein